MVFPRTALNRLPGLNDEIAILNTIITPTSEQQRIKLRRAKSQKPRLGNIMDLEFMGVMGPKIQVKKVVE